MLITGATGFIGHFLVREFMDDYHVICSIRPESKNLRRLFDVKDNVEFIEHEFLDYPRIIHRLKDVSIILHASGNPSSEDSIAQPFKSVLDNILGTAQLLELARNLPLVERFVYYSAGEVFGPIPQGTDSFEDDKYNCISPYAATKASAEELCIAYSNTYNIPVSITHITNTFGEMSQSNRLPVIAMRKILNNEVLTIYIREDGSHIGRRWLHAGDVASHTRFIIDNQRGKCEKWNSAGPRFITNLEFTQMIAKTLNKELQYELQTVSRAGQSYFSISPSKIYNMGWTEQISIEDKLANTVNWYQNNKEWLTL